MKIIRNITNMTTEDILSQLKEFDIFSAAGLHAKGELAYRVIDGRLVQTGATYNADIVIDHDA